MRAALPLLLLRKLATSPAHGYGLIEQLTAQGFPVKGTTVYPLLSKMQSQGYIDASWDTPSAGPPKKVLSITPTGEGHLVGLEAQWQQIQRAMDLDLHHGSTIERKRHDG